MGIDSDASDYFGVNVSLDGTTALLGAFLDDEGASNAGAAYLLDCLEDREVAPSDGTI